MNLTSRLLRKSLDHHSAHELILCAEHLHTFIDVEFELVLVVLIRLEDASELSGQWSVLLNESHKVSTLDLDTHWHVANIYNVYFNIFFFELSIDAGGKVGRTLGNHQVCVTLD